MGSQPEMENSEYHLLENDDIEAAGALVCRRICLKRDTERVDNELLSPLMCKGNQQHVHRSCLDHLPLVERGFAFSHCTTCKAKFHLIIPTTTWFAKFKSAIEMFLIQLLVSHILIAEIGSFAYLIITYNDVRFTKNSISDVLITSHPLLFCYDFGSLGFFVVLIVFNGIFRMLIYGSRLLSLSVCAGWIFLASFGDVVVIVQCHCAAIIVLCSIIFAAPMVDDRTSIKRKLTQEYVVMDLQECLRRLNLWID